MTQGINAQDKGAKSGYELTMSSNLKQILK